MAKIPVWYNPSIIGETGFQTLQNAILPYVNESGQVEGSANLRTGDEQFSGYDPSTIQPPSSLASEKRKMYLSKERAQRALAAISRMRSATGQPLSLYPQAKKVMKYDDAGNPIYSSIDPDTAGLKYLTDSISQLEKLGAPGGAMTRRQYLALLDNSKAMQNSQAARDAGEYAELAKQFLNVEGTKPTSTVAGRTIFGTSNKKLFG
jgi:hypothetical protein